MTQGTDRILEPTIDLLPTCQGFRDQWVEQRTVVTQVTNSRCNIRLSNTAMDQ